MGWIGHFNGGMSLRKIKGEWTETHKQREIRVHQDTGTDKNKRKKWTLNGGNELERD